MSKRSNNPQCFSACVKDSRQACSALFIFLLVKRPGFVFHNLRHSAATYLARDGAIEAQLQAIAGWRSNIVGKYIHMAADDTKAVTRKLSEKIDGTEAAAAGAPKQ